MAVYLILNRQQQPTAKRGSREGRGMKVITIKTQEEFDALPDRFEERTRIEIRAAVGIGVGRAWDNSSVEARGKASVVAWGNASVEAWDNSSVEAWDKVVVRIMRGIKSLSMLGFSVLFMPFDLDFEFSYQETCGVQKFTLHPYLEREGIPAINGTVTLYKRVSADWKTQEGTPNETTWTPGTTVTHPAWSPDVQECGEGKYHACSRPYFADEFRCNRGDRYVAIKIKVSDLHEWKRNPDYPHKIAFREGEVMHECDRFGKKM